MEQYECRSGGRPAFPEKNVDTVYVLPAVGQVRRFGGAPVGKGSEQKENKESSHRMLRETVLRASLESAAT
jgi:hypothetical protein